MLQNSQAVEEAGLTFIDQNVGAHSFTPGQWAVVRQVIHATADFDFAREMVFHPAAVEAGLAAIRFGADIVADAPTVEVGIVKDRLRKYGGTVWCFITDDDVVKKAKSESLPRAAVSMQKAAETSDGSIYVIGNAPTALLELIRLVKEGKAKPSLIIGVPVGFIDAADSKEALLGLSTPFIACRGPKGGSPVAAAIVNALTLLAVQS
ncbi:MAG: precorrin-8X methylmutase [Nitrospirae bacterium]|nr:precorrin-8X methylmutase [Candidatus Manganitrophaceae bacterium]